jgi:VIT1/CCC1 family predicted Fe2+/Mn2+ transporter
MRPRKETTMRDTRTLSTVKLVSGIVAIIGALLAAMMIYTESEPGALPLALIVLGGIGYVIARLKLRGD